MDHIKTAEKIEEKGERLYIFSKIGMFAGLCGFILAIIIGVFTVIVGGDLEDFFYAFTLDVDDEFEFAIPIIILDYLALVLGVICTPLYFYSIQLFVLGNIASNTKSQQNYSKPQLSYSKSQPSYSKSQPSYSKSQQAYSKSQQIYKSKYFRK